MQKPKLKNSERHTLGLTQGYSDLRALGLFAQLGFKPRSMQVKGKHSITGPHRGPKECVYEKGPRVLPLWYSVVQQLQLLGPIQNLLQTPMEKPLLAS